MTEQRIRIYFKPSEYHSFHYHTSATKYIVTDERRNPIDQIRPQKHMMSNVCGQTLSREIDSQTPKMDFHAIST